MVVIRLDEEPVSKTGTAASRRLGSSSLPATASLEVLGIGEPTRLLIGQPHPCGFAVRLRVPPLAVPHGSGSRIPTDY